MKNLILVGILSLIFSTSSFAKTCNIENIRKDKPELAGMSFQGEVLVRLDSPLYVEMSPASRQNTGGCNLPAGTVVAVNGQTCQVKRVLRCGNEVINNTYVDCKPKYQEVEQVQREQTNSNYVPGQLAMSGPMETIRETSGEKTRRELGVASINTAGKLGIGYGIKRGQENRNPDVFNQTIKNGNFNNSSHSQSTSRSNSSSNVHVSQNNTNNGGDTNVDVDVEGGGQPPVDPPTPGPAPDDGANPPANPNDGGPAPDDTGGTSL
jgi:hypothetical protein